MNAIQVQTQNLTQIGRSDTDPLIDGQELDQMVSVALLGDLNQQLADISDHMEFQIEEKQGIRSEIEEIYSMKKDKEILSIEGQNYRDLSPDEAHILKVTQTATPQTNKNGEVTGYRITEEAFQEAADAGVKSRKNHLNELNSNSELTMLKIQSLIDQRKNALTLLSNLLASSNSVAQTIIGNIRN